VIDALEIAEATVDAILTHARQTAPNECCGLLLGAGGRIERSVAARNLNPSPTSYLIDPADHFAAIRTAREEGREVLGAYHSHPGEEAVPSRRDIAEAAGPDFVYLIVSIRPGERSDLRAYRIADGNPIEVGLNRVSDQQTDSRR
jgi:proteasome lid subunit RPN8/RPN11